MGAGLFAFAVGINQALDTLVGALLQAVFVRGIVAAGLAIGGYSVEAMLVPRLAHCPG